MKNKWFSFAKPHAGQNPDVLLFPHAGAGASTFASWGKQFTERGLGFYPVQYPNRETRMNEPMPSDIKELAEELLASDAELFQGNVIFYGKCFGALIAYAVAETMNRTYHHMPILFMTSSGVAPEDMKLKAPSNACDNKEMEQLLLKYGFVTASQLQNENFQEYYLPAVKNDYLLQLSFQDDNYILPCDIVGLYGTNDKKLSVDTMRKWEKRTNRHYQEYAFEGEHFFENKNHLNEILDIIQHHGGNQN